MRRRLLSVVTAVLVAVVVTVPGGANPAHASTGFQTSPPEGCYFTYLAAEGTIVGGFTECMRSMGLHRAVAECADGSIVYGYTEEMEYDRESTATCGDWLFGYQPAVRAWGEFQLDY